ncbi:hypothetical protein GCM10027422_16340 [Hymenobacter arcticus]
MKNFWHDKNLFVFEYYDNEGNLRQHVQSTLPTTKKHAERLAIEKLVDDKIPFGNAKRIYSELEPCELTGGGEQGEGCKAMINSYFPSATVTYSYDYAGTFADTKPDHTASLKKRAAYFTKYQKLKP